MRIRCLVAAVTALLLVTPAFAQTIRRRPADQPRAVTGTPVALDPSSPNAPLPHLPRLEGRSWQRWVVPFVFLGHQTEYQRREARIYVSNIGSSEVVAQVECYDAKGKRAFRGQETIRIRSSSSFVYLQSAGEARLPSAGGWCQVSGDAPILVSALTTLTETRPHQTRPEGAAPQAWYYYEVIPAHPYPAP